VGGDYYDFELEEGQLLLALGDVSGKGTGAALLMAVLRASVRAHWSSGSPADAMDRINRTICQNVPPNKFVTFVLGRLDPASGRLDYVNAGHNAPLLVRADGSVESLDVGGMVLGVFEAAAYAQGQVQLDPGDTLIVYSDGVTETWSARGEEFGEKGLAAIVNRGKGLDAASLQNEILRELDRYASGARATDDRTLIILKRH
jgi:sigma-B regulation protein RsbU (phosphoserine phosphatase)